MLRLLAQSGAPPCSQRLGPSGIRWLSAPHLTPASAAPNSAYESIFKSGDRLLKSISYMLLQAHLALGCICKVVGKGTAADLPKMVSARVEIDRLRCEDVLLAQVEGHLTTPYWDPSLPSLGWYLHIRQQSEQCFHAWQSKLVR